MALKADSARRQVEQLMGRRDAVKQEMARTQHEVTKFASQNLVVETREAKADLERLQQRLHMIEGELQRLRKYW